MESSTSRARPLCPVRGCGLELARSERAWACARRHSFDVARSGYVNLLQPADRRSREPGDSARAVAARARLEERGIGAECRRAVGAEVGTLLERRAGSAALDTSAGTGRLLGTLAESHDLEGWALDISAAAAGLGSRRWPALSWIVANAERRLPFADGSFALVLSSAGPRNPAEFRRVVAEDGALLVAVPAADDLIELREALLGEGRRVDRAERALEELAASFACVARTTARETHRLGRAELEDVCAATYRGARRSQRERLEGLEGLDVTVSAEILRLAPR